MKKDIQFQNSMGVSPVGTMIAVPGSVRFDLQHLGNAQGNLSITDRGSNRRQYRPAKGEQPTSDSKLIRSKYLPFSEGMQKSLSHFEGTQPLTWLDFSNNFGNPNYVSYAQGRLFYPTGYHLGKKFEQDLNTPLFSFVQYPDGRIEFEYVRYEVTKTEKIDGYYDEVLANAFVGDRPLPSDAIIFSSIPLVVNGQPANLPAAIRAGMFQDLRHLFVFPPAKHTGQGKGDYELESVPAEISAGIFFGLEELAANGYETAAQALEHPVTLPMALSISSEKKIKLSKAEVTGLLASRGYVEETDQEKISARQPGEGKFLFVSDSEIAIFLKANPYPHLLVGRTNDGNILVQSVGGVSGRTGITIKEAFQYAQKLGLRDLMSVSQGTGSLIGYLPEGLEKTPQSLEKNYKVIVGASEGRQAGAAVINILSREIISSPVDEVGLTVPDRGGIDFSSPLLNLQIKRDESGVPLPMPQQPANLNIQIEGFIPVIINVTPVPNLPLSLGLTVPEPAEDEDEYSFNSYQNDFFREQKAVRLEEMEEAAA